MSLAWLSPLMKAASVKPALDPAVMVFVVEFFLMFILAFLYDREATEGAQSIGSQ